MDLFTVGSGKKQNATEEELLAAFADDKARGEGLSLEDEDGSALVATGEDFGPYTLEYFPSKRGGTHLKARDELKKQEVQTAMVDYFRGGSAWRDSHSWREVEDDKGGLVTVLATISAVAPWVLMVAGIIFIGHAVSRVLFLGEPAGRAAAWGFAGLVCLIIGPVFATRAGFRGTPRAGG
jgi:hypothetical protein